MILKRLIAISVVLALAAGAVFAEISVSGQVIGTVDILKSDSEKALKTDDNGNPYLEGHPLSASGTLNRIRVEAAGETDDGKFGAWIRAEAGGVGTGQGASFYGNAWWKPIDQLLIRIGSNGYDGFFGKDGVTRWGFYQTATDTGVTFGGANAWGGGLFGGQTIKKSTATTTVAGSTPQTPHTTVSRGGVAGFDAGAAFFGGNGNNAFRATISPLEIIDINVEVPFFDGDPKYLPEGVASSIFKRTLAQVDVKLDAANIALTYAGGLGSKRGEAAVKGSNWWLDPTASIPLVEQDLDNGDDPPEDAIFLGNIGGSAATTIKDPGKFYLYGGIPVGDSVNIDIGLGFTLPIKFKETKDDDGWTTAAEEVTLPPIAAGLGVKFATGSFGVKARVVASFAGNTKLKKADEELRTVEYDAATSKEPFRVFFDVLPYFAVNDNLRIFFSAGLGVIAGQDYEYTRTTTTKATSNKTEVKTKIETDAVVGWHINPYVEIGQEWGPKFLAGVKIWSTGTQYDSSFDKTWTAPANTTDSGKVGMYSYKKVVNWAIPIALNVSF